MAGAGDFRNEIAEEGSPLSNILQHRLLESLSREEVANLARVSKGGILPDDVVEEIARQAGGHPFLAQYLLEIWEDPNSQVSVELEFHSPILPVLELLPIFQALQQSPASLLE